MIHRSSLPRFSFPWGTCHRPADGIPRARPGLVRQAVASLRRLPVVPGLLPAQRAGADARIRRLRGRRSRLGRLASTDTRGGCISIPASLPGISRALQVAFPDLPLSGLQIVDIGFGSTVVETSDGIIVRVARTAVAARGHAVEAAVLPGLAPMLPAAVPVPAYFRPPGAQLPFGAIGYRRLPGKPCRPATATETTGRELGTFLAALHHVEARKFPAMPGPDKVWQHWHNLRKDTELALPGRMTKSEIQRISRWWDQFLADQRMQHYQPAIRHGDLWYGNLLIRPDGAISAVLDWEVVAIADPAQDLALTRYLGPSFTQTVLDAYRSRGGAYDREIQYRIERHWELRELTGIPLAVSAGDEDELSECINKLRAGPILS